MDVLRKFSLVFLFITSLPFIAGCQITYLIRSGYEQTKILSKRKSIESLLKKEELDPKTKAKLQLAQAAKEFAEKKLNLKPTSNYQSYVQLDRPYVSWIVQAAKAYELTPYLWRFPLVGAVPYKGYFTEEGAKEEEKTFDVAEYDTYVRGVTAYSTLGWFNDPLLSSMMHYSDVDLVELIIHESVHATLYFKNQADFNERLATFLGQKGAELYFREKEGADSKTADQIGLEREDQKLFSEFITSELKRLEQWYRENKSEMNREKKADRLKEIQAAYNEKTIPKYKTRALQNILKGPLNNAFLLSLKTYYSDLKLFEELYDQVGGDFSKFLSVCKSLEKEKNPDEKIREFLKN